MTLEEFDIEFDILYNNMASNVAPPINSFEKSILLTRAQEEIVLAYIRPQTNIQKIGIDADALRRAELGFLITKKTETIASTAASPYTHIYTNPETMISILSEVLVFTKTESQKETITIKKAVLPLSAEETTRLFSKVYAMPPKRQVWKLENSDSTNKKTGVFMFDIPTGTTLSRLEITYIRYPNPIIIATTDAGSLKIRGKQATVDSVCELPTFMHPLIVQRAVELAKQAYIGNQQ